MNIGIGIEAGMGMATLMTDAASSWGSLHRDGERVRARLRRDIQHSRGRVWEMLTDSACLGSWLAPGRIEQRLGGAVKIDFEMSGTPIDSQVKAIRIPEILEYSWGTGEDPDRPIRWELTTTDEGTLLQLELVLPDDDKLAISCAGWDAHLEMLMAALEGISIHFPKDRFRQARGAFSALVEQLAGEHPGH